ncbi:predicted protein [Sclerotinia sclerotiorum 1980 UF-70]|uniref:Uncharacterized protein n=1 Tax=Sclerotinia sclerotiorum (strain ATCC 18683 / 1980 / Ss-1) TaxID=665079 RepID=A7EHA4_SCLS1|nr:predicted protein [Sclerotinia sclerotiorum 1980 UF-70]EDO02220.1 predicted protein [Sclerotinia sclerotiorum 1980 UF-70]
MCAAVESCLQDWKRNASCAYRNAQERLPSDLWISSICKCGMGKDVEDFPEDPKVQGTSVFDPKGYLIIFNGVLTLTVRQANERNVQGTCSLSNKGKAIRTSIL